MFLLIQFNWALLLSSALNISVLTAELVAAEHQHLQVSESPERERNIACGIRTKSENRK